MCYKRISLYFLFLTLSSYSWSQNPAYTLSTSKDSVHRNITARYHYGFTIPHHKTMIYWIEDYTKGFEFTYGKTIFKNNWSSYFNFPEIGLGFYYNNLGNDDIYGNVYVLFPYINFHIWRNKRFNLSYKVALGLGYADKPYDDVDNPEDLVIGSNLNAYVGFGFLADYRIHKKISLTTTVSLNHFSNGAAKKPNHGANIASSSIGLKYHISPNFVPDIKKVKAPRIKKKEIIAVIGVGRNQILRTNDQYHWSGSLNIQRLWYRSEKRAWGIGGDLIYFGGAPQYFNQNELQLKQYSNADNIFGGITASYNLFIERITIVTQLGVYVYSNIEPDQPIYTRVGVRYNINDRILANFTVKAGFFKSEFLEFGLGYRIHR